MSDLSRHSRHEHLDEIKHIVAIGGGHGLGRVLSALSFMKERLTGIVTTTDNGGSTGRRNYALVIQHQFQEQLPNGR